MPIVTPTAAIAQTQAGAAAGITNRLEQVVGGLNNGQRDAVRQYAETLVRDRDQYKDAAVAQFENNLKPALSPAQFEQYLANREFVMTGKGNRPRPQAATGPRTQAESASAIVTRLEQLVGGLNNGQRDAVRQYAETLVRDRDQYKDAAVAQFENNLKPALSPAQFEQYLANREFVMTGKGNRPRP
ncbi:hypothetical protein, partial [Hymenobacter sp. BT190]|uniref:hypothetical protein n=1 Tax=Hymenobacter sp. BT190 TaxID=2763505 RepID=UPI0016511490